MPLFEPSRPNHMQKCGVLLVNLGTPDSPQPRDVYRYLNEFLTDGRVIDIPWLWRQFLVRGLIVPLRYRTSAKAYAQIWSSHNGSPLLIHGKSAQKLLQASLGSSYQVELAMRYQNPSIEQALRRLHEADCQRLIILPLFPQYASATTGSVHQRVMEVLKKWPVIPPLHFVSSFPTQPSMIQSFSAIAGTYNLAAYDHILFSFHGLPQRHIAKADRHNQCLKTPNCCQTLCSKNSMCYKAQCHATAQAIAQTLPLSTAQFSICFQSRLGKDPWLQPYTSHTIEELAKQGKKKILVFCPSFVCDCLETLYEIGIEYQHEFQRLGGIQLDLAHGLNDHPLWIQSLTEMVKAK